MSDELDPLPDPVSYHELDRIGLLGCRFVSYRIGFHERVASIPPRIATWIFLAFVAIYSRTVWLLRKIAPDRYTDADPYEHIYVDPSAIEHTTGEKGSKRRGWVVDGDWDQEGNRFMHRTAAITIKQRFVDGVDWDQTALAERYDEREFERRRREIDRLYRAIREGGYKSQRRLLEEDPEAAWDDLNDSMHPLANEVAIDIGRDGELLWNMCGQHRLAIAKVLDVDRIPVQVFRRHENWQRIRDGVRNDERVPEELLEHPDLDSLLTEDHRGTVGAC